MINWSQNIEVRIGTEVFNMITELFIPTDRTISHYNFKKYNDEI